MNHFFLSVVIPVYNEESNIDPLLKKLLPVVSKYDYEIIFVSDGSTDNTEKTVKEFAKKNNRIKLIAFTRNFGHQMALSAGYEASKGDCVISMDADLQDPPELITKMVGKWLKGSKIIYAKRDEERSADSLFKKKTAYLFYRFINFLSDSPIPDNVGDYRLLDRQAVLFLNDLPERSRFLRGLVAWGNYPTEYVFFKREKRFAGKTHYTLSKMVNFALDGITSFSIKPLRIASYLGFTTATLGFVGIIYEVASKLINPQLYVIGWTGLFVSIMFLGGIQLITIGIIGEYVGKIYQEVQKRPKYLVKEQVNL